MDCRCLPATPSRRAPSRPTRTDARTGSSERWTTSAPSSAQCSPWAWSPSLASVPPSSSPSCRTAGHRCHRLRHPQHPRHDTTHRPPVRLRLRPVLASPVRRLAPGIGLFEIGNVGATLLILRATELLTPSRGVQTATTTALVLCVAYNVAARFSVRVAGRRPGLWQPRRQQRCRTTLLSPAAAFAYAAVSRRQRPFPSSQRWGMFQRDPVGESGPEHTDQFPSAAAGSGDEREVLGHTDAHGHPRVQPSSHSKIQRPSPGWVGKTRRQVGFWLPVSLDRTGLVVGLDLLCGPCAIDDGLGDGVHALVVAAGVTADRLERLARTDPAALHEDSDRSLDYHSAVQGRP